MVKPAPNQYVGSSRVAVLGPGERTERAVETTEEEVVG
jgi:hypothetical protein